MTTAFSTVGIAREGKSPENPSDRSETTDLRVAVVPRDIARLLEEGCDVLVEQGAGEGVGFSAEAFEAAGCKVLPTSEIFNRSDLVLKLKGPSFAQIEMMNSGATMGCFAHIDTFPERLKTFQRCGVNLVALEDVVNSPERIPLSSSFGRGLAAQLLPRMVRGNYGNYEILFAGFTEELFAFAQQASRMGFRVSFVQPSMASEVLTSTADGAVFVYESEMPDLSGEMVAAVSVSGMQMLDLSFYESHAKWKISREHLYSNPPKRLGRRQIECLSETGMCGMRYGLELLEAVPPLKLKPEQANIIVFGYGNVAHGAIKEALAQGAQRVSVLGREQIGPATIVPYLENADLIVNGIDLGDEKGKTFIVTRDHIKNHTVRAGTVIVDLIGGSKRERSAIENILECTFLDEPFRQEHGVYFSALWGWPMMYMMKESSEVYSRQITDLLIGQERLIEGLDQPLSEGVERAVHRA